MQIGSVNNNSVNKSVPGYFQIKPVSFGANLSFISDGVCLTSTKFSRKMGSATNLLRDEFVKLRKIAKTIGQNQDTINVIIEKNAKSPNQGGGVSILFKSDIYGVTQVDKLSSEGISVAKSQSPFLAISDWLSKMASQPIVKKEGLETIKINPKNGVVIERKIGDASNAPLGACLTKFYNTKTGKLFKEVDVINGEKTVREFGKNGVLIRITKEYNKGRTKGVVIEYDLVKGLAKKKTTEFFDGSKGVINYSPDEYKSTYQYFYPDGSSKRGPLQIAG